jgi:type I restriction enzyme R subunit
VDTLIRRYKNERLPSIAITVDLLTTGIDVPAICHLVFMRRVRSRILYEQMIGRATRRCDDIGKTVFKIYDPVDIYARRCRRSTPCSRW